MDLIDVNGVKISADEISAALQQIFISEQFRNSDRMREFLQYVVTETIGGRESRIKAYSIAIEVFGRSAGFDAAIDPIVRTTANRLRTALERFNYSPENKAEIFITLPKGGYVPAFEARAKTTEAPAATGKPAVDETAVVAGNALPRPHLPKLVLAAAAVCLAVIAIFFSVYKPVGSEEPLIGYESPDTVLLVSGVRSASEDPVLVDRAKRLSQVLLGHMAGYDVAKVIDTSDALGRRLFESWNEDDDLYSLNAILRERAGELFLNWHLNDARSNEVIWAGEELLGDGSDADRGAVLLASKILGMEGAIPTTLSMIYEGSDDPRQCLSKAQRLALIYHYTLQRGMRACLEELVAQEPNHALAWGILARIYFRMARRAASLGEDPEPFGAMLQDAAHRARNLAPRAYMTQHALLYATYNRKNLAAFQDIARSMLARFGDPHLKIRIGNAFANLGMVEEGMALVKSGIEQSGENEGLAFLSLAFERYARGDYEAALMLANRVGEEEVYLVHLVRAITLAQMGRDSEARNAISKLHELRPAYENNLYADFRHNNVTDNVIDGIAEGLRAAGLTVPKP